MSDDEKYEYRVFVAYRNSGREHVSDRPENPFYDREEARVFAQRFRAPKFTRAWVEYRSVGEWIKLEDPE